MAKLQVFSVYDKAAREYGFPFCSVSKGVAVRSFIKACQDKRGDVGTFPADMELYHLGSFDTETSVFTLHELANDLCYRGADVLEEMNTESPAVFPNH